MNHVQIGGIDGIIRIRLIGKNLHVIGIKSDIDSYFNSESVRDVVLYMITNFKIEISIDIRPQETYIQPIKIYQPESYCCACLDEKQLCAFSCGHLSICRECIFQKPYTTKCPICRVESSFYDPISALKMYNSLPDIKPQTFNKKLIHKNDKAKRDLKLKRFADRLQQRRK